jgi:hypothetical protein
MSQNTGDPTKSTPKAVPAPAATSSFDEDDTPAPAPKAAPAPAATSDAGGDSRAQDILAMIRNRQK